LLRPAEALAQASERYRFGMHDGWGMGSMLFGGFAMLVFWILTIAIIVLIVRWLVGSASDARREAPRKTALDILKERFAKGEIDQAEFEARRKALLD
jgi:putative membrane protein